MLYSLLFAPAANAANAAYGAMCASDTTGCGPDGLNVCWYTPQMMMPGAGHDENTAVPYSPCMLDDPKDPEGQDCLIFHQSWCYEQSTLTSGEKCDVAGEEKCGWSIDASDAITISGECLLDANAYTGKCRIADGYVPPITPVKPGDACKIDAECGDDTGFKCYSVAGGFATALGLTQDVVTGICLPAMIDVSGTCGWEGHYSAACTGGRYCKYFGNDGLPLTDANGARKGTCQELPAIDAPCAQGVCKAGSCVLEVVDFVYFNNTSPFFNKTPSSIGTCKNILGAGGVCVSDKSNPSVCKNTEYCSGTKCTAIPALYPGKACGGADGVCAEPFVCMATDIHFNHDTVYLPGAEFIGGTCVWPTDAGVCSWDYELLENVACPKGNICEITTTWNDGSFGTCADGVDFCTGAVACKTSASGGAEMNCGSIDAFGIFEPVAAPLESGTPEAGFCYMEVVENHGSCADVNVSCPEGAYCDPFDRIIEGQATPYTCQKLPPLGDACTWFGGCAQSEGNTVTCAAASPGGQFMVVPDPSLNFPWWAGDNAKCWILDDNTCNMPLNKGCSDGKICNSLTGAGECIDGYNICSNDNPCEGDLTCGQINNWGIFHPISDDADDSGFCASVVGSGASCGYLPGIYGSCSDGFYCIIDDTLVGIQGICGDMPSLGGDCLLNGACLAGSTCVKVDGDGNYTAITDGSWAGGICLILNGIGGTCDDTQGCEVGLQCVDGECSQGVVPPSIIECGLKDGQQLAPCAEGSTCGVVDKWGSFFAVATNTDLGTCYVVGGDCKEVNEACGGGFHCNMYDQCSENADKGENCEGNGQCAGDLICVTYNPFTGAFAPENTAAGTCMAISPNGECEPILEGVGCETTDLCIWGQCVAANQLGGPCSSNGQCINPGLTVPNGYVFSCQMISEDFTAVNGFDTACYFVPADKGTTCNIGNFMVCDDGEYCPAATGNATCTDLPAQGQSCLDHGTCSYGNYCVSQTAGIPTFINNNTGYCSSFAGFGDACSVTATDGMVCGNGATCEAGQGGAGFGFCMIPEAAKPGYGSNCAFDFPCAGDGECMIYERMTGTYEPISWKNPIGKCMFAGANGVCNSMTFCEEMYEDNPMYCMFTPDPETPDVYPDWGVCTSFPIAGQSCTGLCADDLFCGTVNEWGIVDDVPYFMGIKNYFGAKCYDVTPDTSCYPETGIMCDRMSEVPACIDGVCSGLPIAGQSCMISGACSRGTVCVKFSDQDGTHGTIFPHLEDGDFTDGFCAYVASGGSACTAGETICPLTQTCTNGRCTSGAGIPGYLGFAGQKCVMNEVDGTYGCNPLAPALNCLLGVPVTEGTPEDGMTYVDAAALEEFPVFDEAVGPYCMISQGHIGGYCSSPNSVEGKQHNRACLSSDRDLACHTNKKGRDTCCSIGADGGYTLCGMEESQNGWWFFF